MPARTDGRLDLLRTDRAGIRQASHQENSTDTDFCPQRLSSSFTDNPGEERVGVEITLKPQYETTHMKNEVLTCLSPKMSIKENKFKDSCSPTLKRNVKY